MKKSRVYYALFSLMGFLSACSEIGIDGKNVENTKVVEVAVDEVKLIASSISNPNDPTSFYSSEYNLNQQSKLLLRMGTLRTSTSKIVIEQPVLFRISIKQDIAKIANQKLQLCPIMSEWMMGATWFKPQRQNKKWITEGGDFDMSTCLLPIQKDDPLFDAQHLEEKQFCAGEEVLCYEIKSYINAYIRTRNVDYGFGLINSDPQSIILYGDRTVRGPEILWRKLR